MTPRRIWERVYGDFLMPSRLGEYRALLEAALTVGYAIVSVEGFWGVIRAGAIDPTQRYLVLRHDIDTGPQTAGAMWRIERSLGIESSYYFRLSTLDRALMADIAAAGGEASYHFEELATVAKQRHLRTRAGILAHMPEAQNLFRRNLARLRALTGLPMRVVAAHGDFVNRKLGLRSESILVDPAFRAEVGIDLETYDESFMDHVTSRHADEIHPRYWKTQDPLRAIERGEAVIYLLIHPRGWQTERGFSARENVTRVWESALYALPAAPTRKSRSDLSAPPETDRS